MGRLFSTTRYGSATREAKPDHHSTMLSARPIITPSRKPVSVSYSVTPMCSARLFCDISSSVPAMREGLDTMKASSTPTRVSPSQRATNRKRKPTWQVCTQRVRRRTAAR